MEFTVIPIIFYLIKNVFLLYDVHMSGYISTIVLLFLFHWILTLTHLASFLAHIYAFLLNFFNNDSWNDIMLIRFVPLLFSRQNLDLKTLALFTIISIHLFSQNQSLINILFIRHDCHILDNIFLSCFFHIHRWFIKKYGRYWCLLG